MTGPRAGHIWTLSPEQDFAANLVKGILTRFGRDPLALADITLLLPNRRAIRTVQTAFLQAFDGSASLLPCLRALGESGDEDPAMALSDFSIGTSQFRAAPIDPLERITLLTRLVLKWQESRPESLRASPAHAVQLAKALARFFDQARTEGLDFTGLEALVPEDYASHWQDVLSFLRIVTQLWPELLEARGQVDPADERNALMTAQAAYWEANPPQHPVIAAGSTGSIPSTAQLLKVVSDLPQGHVILPGLDQDISGKIWEDVTEQHPQGALKRLLLQLDVEREEIALWLEAETSPNVVKRLHAVSRALYPGAHFASAAAQREATSGMTPLPGLQLLEAENDLEEATAIALLMRETLETPEKTAALVTPDRQLARRVASVLGRWDITVDDSSGTPLIKTPPATLMRLIVRAWASDFAPNDLLALLKHPFATLGRARGTLLSLVRELDVGMLRGVRLSGGLDGLIHATRNPEQTALLQELNAALPSPKSGSAETLLEAHIAAASALAGDALFSGFDGNALADWLARALPATRELGHIAAEDYGAVFDALLNGEVVRSGQARHPRLAILGSIEARLQRADRMILGGLNECTWPSTPSPDPWMSEPMRVAFGLPPVERRLGLSAHDFVQGCGAREVWLTRAAKRDGAPTLPARWISRLDAAYGAGLLRDTRTLNWAQTLDTPEGVKPRGEPKPRPALALRPKSFSVSDIETWMRDPYAFYVKKILRLRPLDPIDQAPGAADKGTAIHGALERFFKADGERTLEGLLKAGATEFESWRDRPGIWGLWWPRFVDLATWIIERQTELDAQGREIVGLEVKGQRNFEVAGQDWSVRAKADRLDRLGDQLIILDYKTGQAPTAAHMRLGYAPQLPIEALIAQVGGFKLPPAKSFRLEYWSLATTSDGPKIEERSPAEAYIADAEAGLEQLFSLFAEAETPYLHAPAPAYSPYRDYDDLARPEEWRDTPGAQS